MFCSKNGLPPLKMGASTNHFSFGIDFSALIEVSGCLYMVQHPKELLVTKHSVYLSLMALNNCQSYSKRKKKKIQENHCEINDGQKQYSPSIRHQIIGYHYILRQRKGAEWHFSFATWCNQKLQIIPFT